MKKYKAVIAQPKEDNKSEFVFKMIDADTRIKLEGLISKFRRYSAIPQVVYRGVGTTNSLKGFPLDRWVSEDLFKQYFKTKESYSYLSCSPLESTFIYSFGSTF